MSFGPPDKPSKKKTSLSHTAVDEAPSAADKDKEIHADVHPTEESAETEKEELLWLTELRGHLRMADIEPGEL